MKNEKQGISIVICTYNRAQILEKCLNYLVEQTESKENIEVLIIDNNSSDSTAEVVNLFCEMRHNFKYFLEALQGLSAARNRGFQEASYPWVAFIDDDSFVFPDFVERALHVINHYNFDAFGGKVFSQFEKTPPKWFPTNFEEVPIEATENPVFIEDQFFFGCVMLFRKTILQQLNGFKTAYGMSGKKIGYGEETFLQKEMQEKGYKLGFDPMLRVYHQVRADKLKLGWLLRSYYARGRDAYQIYYQQYSGQQFFTDIMMALFIILPKAIVKWIIRPTFYWQHVILEPGSAFAKALGKFCAVRSK